MKWYVAYIESVPGLAVYGKHAKNKLSVTKPMTKQEANNAYSKFALKQKSNVEVGKFFKPKTYDSTSIIHGKHGNIQDPVFSFQHIN